jgi:hypothetical protein
VNTRYVNNRDVSRKGAKRPINHKVHEEHEAKKEAPILAGNANQH